MGESITIKGKRLTIEQDENMDSPREWDNLGKMVMSHRRYNLPNEANIKFENFDGFKEIVKFLEDEKDLFVWLPVYMYEHSGVGLSTSNSAYPYNCPWDSGMAGLIFMTKKEAKENKLDEEAALARLRDEVETYSKYLNGEIYVFRLEKMEKCDKCGHVDWEMIECCGGFYEAKDMKDHVPKEFHEWLDKL